MKRYKVIKLKFLFLGIMTIIVFVIASHFMGYSIAVTAPLGYIGSVPINNPLYGDLGYGNFGSLYGGYNLFSSVPSWIMRMMAVSRYDPSDPDIARMGYELSKPYFQAAVMSGWTPWKSSSYYLGYTAPGGYTPFTSMPYYSSPRGLFSSYYPKFIPTSSWFSGSTPYPITSCSSSKKYITAQSSILTRQNFIIIRDFILNNGTRQTYCNMYNNNPYYQFSDELEAFLNPSSQKYIDCDAPAWEFTELVFRTSNDAPFKYYHIRLGSNSLIIRYEEESESVLEYYFSEALQHIFSFN